MIDLFSNEAVSVGPGARFSSIDQLLGDAQTRFFGGGYRQIRRHITHVKLDKIEQVIEANGVIEYPSTWSTKRERELQPHLSSIDALAIAAQLAEAYLRAAYGLEGNASDLLRVERCTLKPGPSPTTDLEHVASSCKFLGTESVPESLCGHRSRFLARIGTIAVELSIEHPIVTERALENARWTNLREVLGDPERAYYGAAYTATQLSLSDVEFDGGGQRVSAALETSVAKAGRLSGMGAAYYPFVSDLMTIVTVAQLAQALLYRFDDLAREQTNNLWMRKIALHNHKPIPATPGLRLETWSTKMTLLPTKEGVWRTGNFELAVPGITGEYTLAHLLPQSSAVSQAGMRELAAKRPASK